MSSVTRICSLKILKSLSFYLSVSVCVFVCKTMFQLWLSSSLIQPSDPSLWNCNACPHFQFHKPSTHVTVYDAICQGEPRRRLAWRFIWKNGGFVSDAVWSASVFSIVYTWLRGRILNEIIEMNFTKMMSIRQHSRASFPGFSFDGLECMGGILWLK